MDQADFRGCLAMKTTFATLLAYALCAGVALAAPLKLKPADPQPNAPKKGLSVSYAYPDEDIKTLADASAALKASARPGKALSGLDYRDTNEGDKTLTSERAMNVAARITGFVRFDAPGVYEIEFLTNDGLRARIGGQVVGLFDGRQSCDTTPIVEVEVPVAGWYPLDATYFQRLGTACLHMRWAAAGSKLKWTPDAAFGR